MKLDRGTLLLALVSIIVIAVVLVLSNQQAAAPDLAATATPLPGAGPIFPDIAAVENQNGIVRFEVVNNTDDTRIVMTKDAAGVWTVDESASTDVLATDQTKAVGTMSVLASLEASESFTTDDLAQFRLDEPKFTLTLTDGEGTTYTLRVGNQAPANPRYYGLVNDDTTTVYILPKDLIDNLTRQITQPPFVASPTPTATLTRTPNPFSEVEQTATAAVEQTAFFQSLTATAQATAEATGESTAEATPEASEATAEATASQ